MESTTLCAVAGCDRPAKVKGWCGRHYQRWYNHGDPEKTIPKGPPPTRTVCTIDGCGSPELARGMCSIHYQRNERHGNPRTVIRPNIRARPGATLAQRFWVKVDVAGPVPEYAPHLGRCWIWLGAHTDLGYGRLYIGSEDHYARPAHQISYEIHVGPMPPGLVIDHLCRVPACVNPSHLEPVTQEENTRRGTAAEALAAARASITHCPAGHAYEGENLIVAPNGSGYMTRSCRACANIKKREKRRAARVPRPA